MSLSTIVLLPVRSTSDNAIASLHADVTVVYEFIHIASSRFCVRLHELACTITRCLFAPDDAAR